MKLPIDRRHVEALVREFPHLTALQDQLRLSNVAEASIYQLQKAEVEFLIELYRQAGPEWSARAAQLSTLRSALNHTGTRFAAQDLENVVPALAQYLLQDAQRGWLFLVSVFPEATGRDIKGLAKLVAKYCRHRGVAPTLAVFKRCAIFRGMDQSVGTSG